MTLQVECEVKTEFDFNFEERAHEVIEYSLEYIKCPFETEINLTLTDNNGIQELNKNFRGIDKPTDVLSFPLVDYDEPADFSGLEDMAEDYFNLDTGELMLGDIIINVDRVKSQAVDYGHSCERELCFLIVHSMLHLFGFDHMEEAERMVMEDKQRDILEGMGIHR